MVVVVVMTVAAAPWQRCSGSDRCSVAVVVAMMATVERSGATVPLPLCHLHCHYAGRCHCLSCSISTASIIVQLPLPLQLRH